MDVEPADNGPGSFYLAALDLLERACPDKPAAWRIKQAREAVRAIRAAGSPATIPGDPEFGEPPS